VKKIKTDRPGYLIYEDEWQIIAEPFVKAPYLDDSESVPICVAPVCAFELFISAKGRVAPSQYPAAHGGDWLHRLRTSARDESLLDRRVSAASIVVVISPLPTIVELLHSFVVAPSIPLSIFVLLPPRKIRISILMPIVHVRSPSVPEVSVSPSHSVVETLAFPRPLRLVLLVVVLLRAVVFLRLRTLCAGQQSDCKRRCE
jgi:hypothetical protein